MSRKTVLVSVLLTVVILAGIPETFAQPQYISSLATIYGEGSCGTCHVRASEGGPRNSYGSLFENQANHGSDPGAALKAIGQPPGTSAPAETEEDIETQAEQTASVPAKVTPATGGFGIVVSMVGLFASVLLVRRNNN